MSELSPQQQESLALKRAEYEAKQKVDRQLTLAEIVLAVLADNPDRWFFTWELMGATEWGWLSHATHATLRVLEQKGKITKDYIGQYVVYTAKARADGETPKIDHF